ncbi:MAG: hypothetical protein MMC33_005123 [Icmadophila ericetorum]|nr:hypothetical protein [Icmadophila ericetorum]
MTSTMMAIEPTLMPAIAPAEILLLLVDVPFGCWGTGDAVIVMKAAEAVVEDEKPVEIEPVAVEGVVEPWEEAVVDEEAEGEEVDEGVAEGVVTWEAVVVGGMAVGESVNRICPSGRREEKSIVNSAVFRGKRQLEKVNDKKSFRTYEHSRKRLVDPHNMADYCRSKNSHRRIPSLEAEIHSCSLYRIQKKRSAK